MKNHIKFLKSIVQTPNDKDDPATLFQLKYKYLHNRLTQKALFN
jgi:hypothetical protein